VRRARVERERELTAEVGEPTHHLGDLFAGDGLELVGLHRIVDGLLSGDYRARLQIGNYA
jgi:hypothetical protein